MKEKLINNLKEVTEYIIFTGFFLLIIIPLMIGGAILTPIRYYKYVVNKANNKECKSYWY